MMGVRPVNGLSRAFTTQILFSLFCLSAAVPDLEPHKLHLVGGGGAHKAKDRQDTDIVFDSDTNEGLIGQLFGQNLQAFPESTCQTEYMDILGGDMNDGRLPGQRTRSPRQCQKRCQDTKGCNFFAWDRYAGYCWLKRSDGLRIPHPKIIIGPKFCQSPAPSLSSLSSSLSSSSSSVPVVESSSPREPCAITGPSTTEQVTNNC